MRHTREMDMAGSKPLENKVALVVGGGAYMGEAVALRFGRAGAAVVVADPDIDNARAVASAIEAAGSKALAVQVDTASSDSIDAMVQAAVDWAGRIDCVHQGQYTIGTLKTVAETSNAEWHDTVDMDLHGPFYLCRAVAPHMMKQGSGSIILTTSGRGIYGSKDFGAYGTSMAGITGLMKTLQWELGEHGITINCFVPGFVLHERVTKVMGMAKIDALREAAPHKRLPTCENIASFVLYLCTEGSFITGQVHMLATYTE
ncbi:MAG: SDR family oxidoreductase [Alphaproteobacteria bacterium]|nr:MAG: SDR family oxidoreductase [Alphaproteobacteria bacterium]